MANRMPRGVERWHVSCKAQETKTAKLLKWLAAVSRPGCATTGVDCDEGMTPNPGLGKASR